MKSILSYIQKLMPDVYENSMNNKEPAKKKRASSKKKAVEVSNNDVLVRDRCI